MDDAYSCQPSGSASTGSSRKPLTCRADPPHLAAVFGIDDTTAIKYAAIARQLLQTAADQHDPTGSREPEDQNGP